MMFVARGTAICTSAVFLQNDESVATKVESYLTVATPASWNDRKVERAERGRRCFPTQAVFSRKELAADEKLLFFQMYATPPDCVADISHVVK